MTSGGRQRRDGSAKRVRLTSGDHGGPKDKKGKKGKQSRVTQPSREQRAAAARRAWQDLFDRIHEVKKRDQARQQGKPGTR